MVTLNERPVLSGSEMGQDDFAALKDNLDGLSVCRLGLQVSLI